MNLEYKNWPVRLLEILVHKTIWISFSAEAEVAVR